MSQNLQIYCAAVFTNQLMPGQTSYERRLEEHERKICREAPHVLESFHYVGKERYVREMRAAGGRIFLDSGAFSAYTLGATLNIPEYCRYIQDNLDIIRVEEGCLMASVLDAIGDEHETYANQNEMERLGVKPMPTFHAGEETRYLDYYAANYGYMSLGGMVGANPKQLEIWLDRMWNNHLLDGSGNPKIRVHGFGITSVPLMERYPWYSCDSSSWVQSAAFGVIMDAKFGNIQISSKSPSRHDKGQHLTTFADIERAAVEERIRGKGFDPERLADVPFSRFAYNIGTYVDWENDINEKKRRVGNAPLAQELF